MSSDLRNQLRAKALETKTFKVETVVIDDVSYEVHQPSISARDGILKMAGIKSGKEALDSFELSKMLTTLVIYMTFVPGTEERVFEPADAEMLSGQPTGGLVDQLADVAQKLLNIGKVQVKN